MHGLFGPELNSPFVIFPRLFWQTFNNFFSQVITRHGCRIPIEVGINRIQTDLTIIRIYY